MRTAFLAAALLVLAAAAPGAYGAHRGHRAHILRTADGAPGESVTLDPGSGDYRISYFAPDMSAGKPGKSVRHAVFVPATKIDPVIESEFVYRDDREVHYSYRLTNGRRGRQAVARVLIEPVSDVSALLLPPKSVEDIDIMRKAQLESTAATALVTPANWTGRVTTSPGGGLRITWDIDEGGRGRGLLPGKTQPGFAIPANDLPGVVLAQITSDAPVLDLGADGPQGDIRDRLYYLAAHNYVTRPIAVPSVTVPDPYDGAILLERVQAQMHTWIPIRLIDPLFSARLDHHLAAAAGALRQGMPEAARFDIQAIHTLLALQHPALDGESGEAACLCLKPEAAQIDLLAARTLDFDLRYVVMRMGH